MNTDSIRVEYRQPTKYVRGTCRSYRTKELHLMKEHLKDQVSLKLQKSGFAARADGPDDYFIDAEEVGGSKLLKSLDSDVSALKEYATGQETYYERNCIQNKKRKDKVKRIK